ncbi:uncharacterized protein trdc [Siphateles boraxobius]|uniref:uncharacterized protein trdc n=1 Tax=Siphateles boraxobius TaxID=180520 RepID=UPI004064A6D0
MTALSESRPVMAVLPESRPIMPALPESRPISVGPLNPRIRQIYPGRLAGLLRPGPLLRLSLQALLHSTGLALHTAHWSASAPSPSRTILGGGWLLVFVSSYVSVDWGTTGYGSGAFSATDTLTFGKPITLTVLPKDVSPSPPGLSILSPLKDKEQDKKGKEQDICVAAGFYPKDKTMTLTVEGKSPVSLNANNAELFKSSKTYYYAGFSGDTIQKCEMEKEMVDKDQVKSEESPDAPVTESPIKPTSQSCEGKASSTPASVFNRDDPKMKSMTLLVTGLRILLAKCVAVNVLMTVKAFLF